MIIILCSFIKGLVNVPTTCTYITTPCQKSMCVPTNDVFPTPITTHTHTHYLGVCIHVHSCQGETIASNWNSVSNFQTTEHTWGDGTLTGIPS